MPRFDKCLPLSKIPIHLLTNNESESILIPNKTLTYPKDKIMTNASKNLIANLYLTEEEPLLKDTSTTKITVRAPFDVVAMFTCLATRFDINRFDLIEPVLKEAAQEMFLSLSPSDREIIAKQADDETVNLMKKAGITSYDWEKQENVDPTSISWSRALKMLALDKEETSK